PRDAGVNDAARWLPLFQTQTYAARMPPKSVYVAPTSGVPLPLAPFTNVMSMGTMGTSGFTMTPSERIALNRLALLSVPRASPTPSIPADRVARMRLSSSLLMNVSTHGHSPSALARRDV